MWATEDAAFRLRNGICLMMVLDYTLKHLLFLFLLHLCFLEIMYRRCVQRPLPYNNENTDSEHKYNSNIFRLFLSISQVYLNVINVST